jgi:hypothetical protein
MQTLDMIRDRLHPQDRCCTLDAVEQDGVVGRDVLLGDDLDDLLRSQPADQGRRVVDFPTFRPSTGVVSWRQGEG